MRRTFAVAAAALALACGSGSGTDSSGLIVDRGDVTAFARASQLYFRGSLSRAREGFNVIVYRYPGSPLAEDARMALRRIDQDLGDVHADTSAAPARGTSVAVVGLPANSPKVQRLVSALTASGWNSWAVQDSGAPDLTVVLYPDGLEGEAAEAGDSLDSWLTSPDAVPVQPAGQMTEAIVPGHDGLVVILGGDATFANRVPQAEGAP